jgi:uncharacterized protein (TIGR02996 family)
VPSDADGRGLLRAVLEEPGEDAHRLVYADWLDEQGQSDRAEFIRVQVELARLAFLDDDVCPRCGVGESERHARGCPTLRLRRLERALLRQARYDWLAVEGMRGLWGVTRRGWRYHAGWTHGAGRRFCADLRRGFVWYVDCTTGDFLEQARAIFLAHPIERVRLLNRTPHPDNRLRSGFSWESGHGYPYRVEPELFRHLKGGMRPYQYTAVYDGRGAANQALEVACVRYGREVAGLPPLSESCPLSSGNLD